MCLVWFMKSPTVKLASQTINAPYRRSSCAATSEVGSLSSVPMSENVMSQNVKPPRIVFVRPKSAGSIRGRSQAPGSLAPTSHASGKKIPAPRIASISVAGSTPPQPVRPSNNTMRRPSSAVGPRRCFTTGSVSALPVPKTTRNVNNLSTRVWEQQDAFDLEPLPEIDVANMYHAVVARKDAEDVAQQLARRIAHFRTQEERVLREMQSMRTHLETNIAKTRKSPKAPVDARVQVHQTSRMMHLQGHSTSVFDPRISQGITKQSEIPASPKYTRRLGVPRSREQLEFLAKQKRALEVHKLEAARQQRERQKLALAKQKAKEAEQEYKRRCRKECIRAEEQQAIEQRIEKQRRLREAATKQHCERLLTERKRQHDALNLISEMEEEERNLRLRLEALHFHREHMEQELCCTATVHGGI